jgi:small subunit ribosomal protein S4
LVYRAGLARSIYAARQYVTHGHLEVNGKRVNIPSCNVEIGDVITVKEKSRKMPCCTEALETTIAPPAYLDRNEAEMSAKLLYRPKREEVPTICEMSLVIEFYSR